MFFLKQHFMNTCERRFQVVCMISDESAIEVYGIPSYCSLFASYCSLFSWFQSLLLRQVVFSHRILAEPVPFRQKGPWCWPLWTAELRIRSLVHRDHWEGEGQVSWSRHRGQSKKQESLINHRLHRFSLKQLIRFF